MSDEFYMNDVEQSMPMLAPYISYVLKNTAFRNKFKRKKFFPCKAANRGRLVRLKAQ